jgi:L-2-hydroxyglutarate oxidase LhgO
MPQCFIIGAGAVGLAVARALSRQLEVVILESRSLIGSQTSSRNSEVIHSGIYYTPGSLKAKLCVVGCDKMYQFAKEYAVEHRQCGKIIVATSSDEIKKLNSIRKNGIANGVRDLRLLNPDELRSMEPQLSGIQGLFVPITGIINSHQLMTALQGEAEGNGAVIAYNCTAYGATHSEKINKAGKPMLKLKTSQGDFDADIVINCAGHGASYFAARCINHPLERVPRPYFSKGSYFKLTGSFDVMLII